jgi:hypothetical protein
MLGGCRSGMACGLVPHWGGVALVWCAGWCHAGVVISLWCDTLFVIHDRSAVAIHGARRSPQSDTTTLPKPSASLHIKSMITA